MLGVELNLAAGVFSNAQVIPGAPALVVGNETYSYSQLADRAARVAQWLHGRRPAQPLVVGILAFRSLETYVGILGAAWAGGTYLPLDPRQPPGRIAAMLQQAGVGALIVDERGQRLLPQLPALPAVLDRDQWSSMQHTAPLSRPVEVGPEHPAYIIFTSGSTGVPKGVIAPAAAIGHYRSTLRTMFRVSPADRVSQFFDTTFDASLAEIFSAWDGGAALYVVPETKTMAPGGFIRQHGITVFHAVPSLIAMMRKVHQLEPGSLPSIRVSVFGGESLFPAAARAWRAAAVNSTIDNQYGPTEAAVGCIAQRVGEEPVETPERGTLSVGTPFPGMQVAVVDPLRNLLPPDEIGELALSGPQLASGYVGDPAMTDRKFATIDGRRWYFTGDLGRIDARGYIHCLGRIDHQVKVMGHRVELEDIDAHLRSIAGVDSVATVAWPIIDGHVAGTVSFIAGPMDPSVTREKLRQRVPAYMLPGRVIRLDQLPLSSNGKIDRNRLTALLDNQALTAGGQRA